MKGIRIFAAVVAFLLFLIPQGAKAANPPTVYIDGQLVLADVLPYVTDTGTVMLPFSLLSDPCPEDYLFYSALERHFFTAKPSYSLLHSQEASSLPKEMRIESQGDHLFISLPYLADVLGDHVTWDPIRRAVYIGDLPETVLDPLKPMVALTFDDGPSPGKTDRILETLAEVDGRATFFMLGSNVAWQPALAWQVAARGHEIGNHSYNHPNMAALSPQALQAQIDQANQAIQIATGQTPSLIRPTYGALSPSLQGHAPAPLILWNVDPQDWRTKNAQATVDHVLARVQDGAIVLLHDIHEPSVQATKALIKELDARGYQLVTVSELMASKGMEAGPGKVVTSG